MPAPVRSPMSPRARTLALLAFAALAVTLMVLGVTLRPRSRAERLVDDAWRQRDAVLERMGALESRLDKMATDFEATRVRIEREDAEMSVRHEQAARDMRTEFAASVRAAQDEAARRERELRDAAP